MNLNRESKRLYLLTAVLITGGLLIAVGLISFGHELIALTLLIPMAVIYIIWVRYWILRSRREKRVQTGLCGNCGYDLTANASGVCPECGVGVERSIQIAGPAVPKNTGQ